ncbi:b33048fe-c91d-4b05-b913-1883e5fd39fc [Thermothielavioides terrestris]|uniref:B33048fe-c91d-4b05-b913-1883e5fd39fc n=1 Tax=Thermothielavioides terrestris TaxID=2587410 RepID=A0A3S4BG82_9PEZI|nr:b33048fe-c91d-4b05-b913-1883e5fd39fc [Thermothielavioides terrestris]
MAHLTSFSDAATATSIPCVPLFEGPIPDRASETENALGIYSWLYSNPVDYTFQEIAQITQRIHAAALRITSPATTSVPLSSPAVSDILDAANTLVYLQQDNSQTRTGRRPPVSPPTHNTNPPDHCISSCVPSSPATAIDDALDASIRLTIHAAHQALLGVFDALSASCLLYLTAGPQQQQQHQHQQTNPHAAPPQTGCPSVPPSLSQIAATTNLLRSLLDQLDRVVLALGNAGPAQAQQQQQQQQQEDTSCGESLPLIIIFNTTNSIIIAIITPAERPG